MEVRSTGRGSVGDSQNGQAFSSYRISKLRSETYTMTGTGSPVYELTQDRPWRREGGTGVIGADTNCCEDVFALDDWIDDHQVTCHIHMVNSSSRHASPLSLLPPAWIPAGKLGTYGSFHYSGCNVWHKFLSCASSILLQPCFRYVCPSLCDTLLSCYK